MGWTNVRHRAQCAVLRLRGRRRRGLLLLGFVVAVLLTAAAVLIPPLLPTSPPGGDGSPAADAAWFGPGLAFLLFGALLTFVAGVLGNLWANWLQDRLDALPRPADGALANHDLAGLVGEAVRLLLMLIAQPPPKGPPAPQDLALPSVSPECRARLPELAACAPEFWMDLVRRGVKEELAPFAELHEPKLSRYIINPRATAMDVAAWRLFLDQLSIFGRTRRRMTSLQFPAQGDLDAVAGILAMAFGHAFREALKHDHARGGLGWAAFQLEVMGQMLYGAQRLSTDAGMADTAGRVAMLSASGDFQKMFAARFQDFSSRIDALGGVLGTHTAHLVAIRDRLAGQHAEVLRGLETIARAQADHEQKSQERHEETIEILKEVRERVAEDVERREDPCAQPTDNFADAGIGENNAFVGRKKDLADLDQLVHQPEGPTAVVIVAGAGFGKTELAKHYLFTQRAASPNRAEGWAGWWWIDASAGGEMASARKLYTRLTGQDPPPMDKGDSEASYLPKLRTAIRDRLSSGRHLLVLDNAEDAEQIRSWSLPSPSRVIATTRRQPIPKAIAHTLDLDVLAPEDAVLLLKGDRTDLESPESHNDLTTLAEELGRHALALAYAAATLARVPHQSPRQVLEAIRAKDVGDESHILADIGPKALGTEYRLPLARSLSLLMDEIKEPLPHAVLAIIAFCHPDAIPLEVIYESAKADRAEVDMAIRTLHGRSLVKCTDTVSVHRLTQSLVRSRLSAADPETSRGAILHLLQGLSTLYSPVTDHRLVGLFRNAWPHAEEAIVHVDGRYKTPAIEAEAARLSFVLARFLQTMGQLTAAADHIERSIAWGETQSPRDERALAIDYAERAGIRQERGDLKGAQEDIGRSIEWAEAQRPRDERDLAIMYAVRAGIRQQRGDLQGADEDIGRSIAWAEAQKPRDERGLAVTYATRAGIRQVRGDLQGADADINHSITWLEAQSPRDERALAIDYASRARIRQLRRELKGAQEDIDRSITWAEAQSPRDERSLAIDYASRAEIRHSRGDFKEAEEDIGRSIAWAEAQTPRNERSLAIRYASRAGIRRDRGDLKGAEEDIDRSIAWGEAQNPRDERSLAVWYASHAGIRAAMAIRAAEAQDRENARRLIREAIAEYQTAIATHEAALGPDNPGTTFMHFHLAQLLAAVGTKELAVVHARRSIELGTASLGADHPSVAALAAFAKELGDPA